MATGARTESIGFYAVVGLVFGTIAVFSAADLLADLRENVAVRHLVAEGILICAGVVGAGVVASRLLVLRHRTRDLETQASQLEDRLHIVQRQSDEWRRESLALIHGLSASIDRQLGRWGLSPAEKEVALLLLKGLSHREIAKVRKVGEVTVRQQSAAVYRKAGLQGRHDLAAFFLEDLLDTHSDTPMHLSQAGREEKFAQKPEDAD